MVAEISRETPDQKELITVQRNLFVVTRTGEVVEVKPGDTPPNEDNVELSVVLQTDERGRKSVLISAKTDASQEKFLDEAKKLQNDSEMTPNPQVPTYVQSITFQSESVMAQGSESLRDLKAASAIQISGPNGNLVYAKDAKTGKAVIIYTNAFDARHERPLANFLKSVTSSGGINDLSVKNVFNKVNSQEAPSPAKAAA